MESLHYNSEPTTAVRAGFTIIELMVSLAIIGLLLAIFLPAVQQARAVSQRTVCRSHLHQIGIAAHHMHEEKGKFPRVGESRDLLPYLDAQFQPNPFPDGYSWVFGTLEQVAASEHMPISSVPMYVCPADPAQNIVNGLVPSYYMNQGTGFAGQNDGFIKTTSLQDSRVALRDVTDGLSQTAMFAERLLYRGTFWDQIPDGVMNPTSDQMRRRVAQVNGYYQVAQIDQFADQCENHAVWFGGMGGILCTPYPGGCSSHNYNHIMTPNQNSCYNGFGNDQVDYLSYSAMTSTSLHLGGVNALFADGAVHFISDSIDRDVWRSLGTRNGNEVVSELPF